MAVRWLLRTGFSFYPGNFLSMAPERAFALVDGDQGAWRCHLATECTEVCPSDALPAEGIMHLRRGLLRHRFRVAFARLRMGAGGAGEPGGTP